MVPHCLFQQPGLVKDPAGVFDDPLAPRGGRDAARGPLENAHAQGLLRGSYGAGNAGLGGAQGNGGIGKRLSVRDGHERPQMAQLKIHTVIV
jgi:hypothetical protein